MSDLRTAAKQALAFLRWSQFGECRTDGWNGPPPKAHEVEAALRAALAEPVQEPVAWMDPQSGEVCRANWLDPHAPERDVDRFTCALYTCPPQRKPLTDDEVNALEFPPGTTLVRDLVRLVERAHGIGGRNDSN